MGCTSFESAKQFYIEMVTDLCKNFPIMDEVFHYGKDFIKEKRAQDPFTIYEGYTLANELLQLHIPTYLKEKYRVKICRGAYRIVFISNDYDYVLKISYDNDEGKDCNQTEKELYEQAAVDGVEQYFASVDDIGIIFSSYANMYLAEKCEVDEEKLNKYEDCSDPKLENIRALSQKYTEEHNCYSLTEGCGDCVLYAFIHDYFTENSEDLYALVKFLETFGITDLHDNNVGFDFQGKIKIIDYSLCW